MDKFLIGIGVVFLGALAIAVVSVLGGTIVFVMWKPFIQMVPVIVEKGWVSVEPSWWQCVATLWVISIFSASARQQKDKNKESDK